MRDFALTAAVVSSVLAGCGGSQEPPPATANAGVASAQPAAAAPSVMAPAPSSSAPLASAAPTPPSAPAASASASPATPAPSASPSALTCGKSDFQLSGPLDGEPAKGAYANPVYSFMNAGSSVTSGPKAPAAKGPTPGTLDVTFATKGQLHLKFTTGMSWGDTVPATGSVTMPTEGPHPGKAYCIKAATITTPADGNGVTFAITSLAKGACTGKAEPATLHGCATPQ